MLQHLTISFTVLFDDGKTLLIAISLFGAVTGGFYYLFYTFGRCYISSYHFLVISDNLEALRITIWLFGNVTFLYCFLQQFWVILQNCSPFCTVQFDFMSFWWCYSNFSLPFAALFDCVKHCMGIQCNLPFFDVKVRHHYICCTFGWCCRSVHLFVSINLMMWMHLASLSH